MPDPYISKNPNDIIRAQDWNDIQIRTRTDVEGHAHTGGTAGVKLTGDAIDQTASLKVKGLTITGSTSLQDVAATKLTVSGSTSLQDLAATKLTLSGAAILPEVQGTKLTVTGSTSLQDLAATKLTLSGVAILPEVQGTKLTVSGATALQDLTATKLTVNGIASSPDVQAGKLTVTGVATLPDVQAGKLSVASDTAIKGILSTGNDVRLSDRTIYLRSNVTSHDGNHGLAYRDKFAGQAVDGPALFGCNGGVLGTSPGGVDKAALSWDGNGNVKVSGRLTTKAARMQKVATDQITCSGVYTLMAGMEMQVPVQGGPLLIMFKGGGCQASTINARPAFRLMVNNVEVTSCRHEFHNAGWELRDVSLTHLLESTTPGNCNIRVEWGTDCGMAHICYYNSFRTLMAIEL